MSLYHFLLSWWNDYFLISTYRQLCTIVKCFYILTYSLNKEACMLDNWISCSKEEIMKNTKAIIKTSRQDVTTKLERRTLFFMYTILPGMCMTSQVSWYSCYPIGIDIVLFYSFSWCEKPKNSPKYLWAIHINITLPLNLLHNASSIVCLWNNQQRISKTNFQCHIIDQITDLR